MKFLKQHKNKIILALLTVIVLVIAYMAGDEKTQAPVQETAPTLYEEPLVTEVAQQEAEHSEEQSLSTPQPTENEELQQVQEHVMQSTEELPTEPVQNPSPKPQREATEKATIKPTSEPVPEPTPEPVIKPTSKPKEKEKTDDKLTCTLSVKCHTILNNMSKLKSEKAGLVPTDGVIFPETEVEFYEGETVINILTREMKKNKIHLEFVNVPLYNSAYIEGIANIYEHDCGELSGWMYRVNDNFPNYGASGYKIKNGDRIEWIYTCDLGNDIGGGYTPRNGRKNDN